MHSKNAYFLAGWIPKCPECIPAGTEAYWSLDPGPTYSQLVAAGSWVLWKGAASGFDFSFSSFSIQKEKSSPCSARRRQSYEQIWKYIAIIIIIMSELIKLVHEAVKCKNISLIKWICQCIHLIHGKRYKAHSWTLVDGWCSIAKPPLQVCTNQCSYFRTTPKIFTNLFFYFQTTFQECTNLSIFLHDAFKPKKMHFWNAKSMHLYLQFGDKPWGSRELISICIYIDIYLYVYIYIFCIYIYM